MQIPDAPLLRHVGSRPLPIGWVDSFELFAGGILCLHVDPSPEPTEGRALASVLGNNVGFACLRWELEDAPENTTVDDYLAGHSISPSTAEQSRIDFNLVGSEPMNRLQATTRLLMKLDIELAQNEVVVLSVAGLAPLGVRQVFSYLATNLTNRAVIHLADLTSLGRDCPPNACCLKVSRERSEDVTRNDVTNVPVKFRVTGIRSAITDPSKLLREVAVGRDLTGADLRNLCLEGCDLRKLRATGADLRGSKLAGANLEDAELSQSSLREVDLRDARLDRATLVDADLEHASAQGALLRKADLSGASLRSADFSNADLKGSTLVGVNVEHANLRGARIRGAETFGTNLLASATPPWGPVRAAWLRILALLAPRPK